MKRVISMLAALCLLICGGASALAANGEVSYAGRAEEFIFAPGSEYSPTDLFPELKDVMPGDTLEQYITVRNDAANGVKIKVYIRALGAHEDSAAFLSQLGLTVEKMTDTILFDAAADETAQLTDWTCLGTLYSGGECELKVTLRVPVTLDNEFKNLVGYLDWEFMVEELPVESTDPEIPETGDDAPIVRWAGMIIFCAAALIPVILPRKKARNQ